MKFISNPAACYYYADFWGAVKGVVIFMNKFMKIGLRGFAAHHFVSHCLTVILTVKQL